MPLRYSLSLVLLAAMSIACGSPATAAIPYPATSTVPPGFVACPWGDVGFTVVVRDLGRLPVVGAIVELDFGGCASFPLCDDCCPGVTLDPVGHRASKATGADGAVTFSLKTGGICDGQQVLVRASGILIAIIPMASPDQTGDLYVGVADGQILAAKLGTQDRTADFDFDGWVTQADLDWVFPGHAGHSCHNDVLDARRPTWGTLKVLYR